MKTFQGILQICLNRRFQLFMHFLELNVKQYNQIKTETHVKFTFRIAKAPASIFIWRIFSFKLSIFFLQNVLDMNMNVFSKSIYLSVSVIIVFFVSVFIWTRTSPFTFACSLKHQRVLRIPKINIFNLLFQCIINIAQLFGIIIIDIFFQIIIVLRERDEWKQIQLIWTNFFWEFIF